MSAEHREGDHLDPGILAAYTDGLLPPAEHAAAEAHMADCDSCRGDMVAASRLTRERAPLRRWYVPAALGAAAALLLMVGRDTAPPPISVPVSREPVISTTVVPVALAPRGAVHRPTQLIWTSVPYADLYRVTIFDDAGNAIFESQARDTSVSIPADLHIQPRTSYFWKLEAQTGWNRWIPSELTEFSVDPKGP